MLTSKAITEYLQDPVAGLDSRVSRRGYRYTLHSMERSCPSDVSDITEQDLVAWVTGLGVAPSTQRTYITILRGFFRWTQWKGYTTGNPADYLVKILRPKAKAVLEHHWLGEDEVRRVFDAVDTTTAKGRRDLVILRLGFTCGLRRAEIQQLTWGDVSLETRTITIRGKGDKLATLHLNDATCEAIAAWRQDVEAGVDDPVITRFQHVTIPAPHTYPVPGSGVSPETIRKITVDYGNQSGVTFRPHDMRRSFAAMIHDRAGMEAASAALRHSNLGTTQRYLEKRQDASAQAVKAAGLDL